MNVQQVSKSVCRCRLNCVTGDVVEKQNRVAHGVWTRIRVARLGLKLLVWFESIVWDIVLTRTCFRKV